MTFARPAQAPWKTTDCCAWKLTGGVGVHAFIFPVSKPSLKSGDEAQPEVTGSTQCAREHEEE